MLASIFASIASITAMAFSHPSVEGVPAPEVKFVFVQDTDRRVAIDRGDVELIGKLDEAGNFTEKFKHVKHTFYSGPLYYRINSTDGKPRKVYEFRSGRLIKGELDTSGNFVPEVGSTVISFKDYKYSPDAIPIWNLPGKFVIEGDKKKTRSRVAPDADFMRSNDNPVTKPPIANGNLKVQDV
jgi:hypothetical protein